MSVVETKAWLVMLLILLMLQAAVASRAGHDIARAISNVNFLEDEPQAFSFEWSACNPTPVNCGFEYFKQVREQFKRATKEIIIMGWWTHWNVPLFRDPSSNLNEPTETLSQLIEEAATRGVQVYVLFWRSLVSEKMGYAILEDAEKLFAISPKVHVLMDNSRDNMPMVLWSAHIKVTIFDRSTAFAGGIDFALTRLDTPDHLLPDTRRAPDSTNVGSQHGYGKPWQDVMVRVDGQQARDLARIAIERWLTFCESLYISEALHDACSLTNKLLPDPADDFGNVAVSIKGSTRGVKVTVYGMGNVERGYTQKTEQLKENEDLLISLGNRRDLGVRATLQVEGHGQQILLADLFKAKIILADSATLLSTVTVQRPQVEGAVPAGDPSSDSQQCRVMLSGDRSWLGSSTAIADIYKEHIRMINEAQFSVYIENQYFNSWVYEGQECSGPFHPQNIVSRVLFAKIVSMARSKKDFSVVIVFPLATEEPETQFPNLRAASCFQERLQTYWKEHADGQGLKPLENYFGMYHLANLVHSQIVDVSKTHFYGIFVHSKLIVVDYENAATAQSIVGSANINDRSLIGDRDAEVSVGVKGHAFAQKLMSELLGSHAGLTGETLPGPGLLAAKLNEVAMSNAEKLRPYGIQWVEGRKGTTPLFDAATAEREKVVPAFGGDDAYRLGSGVHWAELEFVTGSVEVKTLSGHLFPYSFALWGDPDQYRTYKHRSEAAWAQVGQEQQ